MPLRCRTRCPATGLAGHLALISGSFRGVHASTVSAVTGTPVSQPSMVASAAKPVVYGSSSLRFLEANRMAKDKEKRDNDEKKHGGQATEKHSHDSTAQAVLTNGSHDEETQATPKMSRKEFEREVRKLQVELVKLQEWVKATGAKIIVVFEGRDTAGKGGVIKALTERTSPRVFRVVALPAPTEREKSQMYIQRYITHFPAAGEVVLFDRSWYNRAGVERVMGFATAE